VDRCKEIVANVRMEERYAGMSLVFSGTETLRQEVETAIEKVTKQTKMDPHIFDNSKDHNEAKQSLYIEFKELRIDKCANDVI